MAMRTNSPSRRAVSSNVSVPAPTGGLNARDAVADMPATDAILMDNWFPDPSSVSLRNGYVKLSTGLPGWVETLMAYGSTKLFAISGGSIYDCTLGGTVPAASVVGLTNSRWQHVNIGTPGGQFLIAVNGIDNAQIYNGTAWSNPSFTGIATSNLIHVNLYKNRLWFTERNSFRVWYPAVNSIGGTLTSLDLSSLFKLGGFLMGMITITIDNAGGINEFCAFVSSEGEVALYGGADPTTASGFTIQGFFRIGRPIGRRFYCKVGSDVVLLTADGCVTMSKALLTDRSQNQDALSDKIVNMVSADVTAYSNNFGWQPLLHPMGGKLFINVPQVENNTQYQYVMNTVNGSWCRFTGWNAACWELFKDNVYFGGNLSVGKADFGATDNGGVINADVQQASSYFGMPGRNKRWTMCRPLILTNGSLNLGIGLNVDYAVNSSVSSPTFSTGGGTPWYSPWYSKWSISNALKKDWQTVTGLGFTAGLRMKLAGKGIIAKWQATDFVYEPGGIL